MSHNISQRTWVIKYDFIQLQFVIFVNSQFRYDFLQTPSHPQRLCEQSLSVLKEKFYDRNTKSFGETLQFHVVV